MLTLGESGAPWAETLRLGEWNWRWMLGIETLPAILYLVALMFVPESPRWLAMQGRDDEAHAVLARVTGEQQSREDLRAIKEGIEAEKALGKVSIGTLFHPSLRLVLTIGLSVGILQQITGINSVFFYAPMIFEQSGIGTNASFMQAVLVGPRQSGVFTIVAMIVDRPSRAQAVTRVRADGYRGVHAGAVPTVSAARAYKLDQAAIDGSAVRKSTGHGDFGTRRPDVSTVTSEFRVARSADADRPRDVYQQFESQLVSSAIDDEPDADPGRNTGLSWRASLCP